MGFKEGKEIAVGKRMRHIRDELRLSQSDVASEVGLSSNHYSRIERGLLPPRMARTKLFCAAFGVNKDWLLSGKGLPMVKSGRPDVDRLLGRANDLLGEIAAIGRVLAMAVDKGDARYAAVTALELLPSHKCICMDLGAVLSEIKQATQGAE